MISSETKIQIYCSLLCTEKSEVQSTQKKRIQNVNQNWSCSFNSLEEGGYINFEEERDNFNKNIKVISHNVILFFLNKDKLSFTI